MQLWWPSSRECSPTPCLMQLFKRFTENSVMELYWFSYLCDANVNVKPFLGKHLLYSPAIIDSVPFLAEMLCEYGKWHGTNDLNIASERLWAISRGCCTLWLQRPKACLKSRLFTVFTSLAHSWWEQDNAPTRPLRSGAVWCLHVARYQEGFLLSGLNTRSTLSHSQTLTTLSCWNKGFCWHIKYR